MSSSDLSFVPDTEAGRAFREAMSGRSYGHAAASDAWAWFKYGWEQRLKPVNDDMDDLWSTVDEVFESASAAFDKASDVHKKVSDMHKRAVALLCEHANEVPIGCVCPPHCYCKTNTCIYK